MKNTGPLALSVALLGLTLAACGGGGDEANPTPPAAKPSSTLSTPSGVELPPAVQAVVDTKAEAWGLITAPGAAWVQVDPPVDAVVRIDTKTAKITNRVERGRNAAFDGKDLWVPRGNEIVRLDPESLKVFARVRTAAVRIAVGEGAVWAGGDVITRIDSETNRVVARIPTPTCVEKKELAVGFGSVWQACRTSGGVVRIDPRTNRVVATIPTASGAHHIVFGGGSVWVSNYDAATLSRIDPRTNEVVATLPGVGDGVGLEFGLGYVWAAEDNGIAKIDPATNEVVGKLELPFSVYYGMGFADGALWVSSVVERMVLRIDPAKI